jgi:hypothetical protein
VANSLTVFGHGLEAFGSKEAPDYEDQMTRTRDRLAGTPMEYTLAALSRVRPVAFGFPLTGNADLSIGRVDTPGDIAN